MTASLKIPVIFLIAGEPSGDLLGARLMRALRVKTGDKVRFTGIGGERMQAEGLELFFPQAELTHFGLIEILRHVPNILRRIRETVAEIKRLRPAALVTIDAPDFSFRVAKQLKGQGVPLIHYVAPTVWAWRPKRAKKIAAFLDHLITLLPFEPPYFTREGLPCSFAGHSIVESLAGQGNAARFRARHGIAADQTIVTILLGSRRGEVTRLGPVFGVTLRRLKDKYPDLVFAVPTVPQVEAQVRARVADWPAPCHIVLGDEEKYDAFAASTVALACSGTVSIELAMARLPTVIAYRISALTYALYRRLIKVNYVTLMNLMHNRMVMPEYLQQDCTPEKLANAVGTLLDDPAARQTQIGHARDFAKWLGKDDIAPSERAAAIVLDVAGLAQTLAEP